MLVTRRICFPWRRAGGRRRGVPGSCGAPWNGTRELAAFSALTFFFFLSNFVSCCEKIPVAFISGPNGSHSLLHDCTVVLLHAVTWPWTPLAGVRPTDSNPARSAGPAHTHTLPPWGRRRGQERARAGPRLARPSTGRKRLADVRGWQQQQAAAATCAASRKGPEAGGRDAAALCPPSRYPRRIGYRSADGPASACGPARLQLQCLRLSSARMASADYSYWSTR